MSALLLWALTASAMADPVAEPVSTRPRPVETITYDDPLPSVVQYRGLRGELLLDGQEISGHRSDLRSYLEYALPYCPAAAKVERNRRVRWRVGNAVAFTSIGGVIVAGLVAPDAQVPMIALGGSALLGLGITASSASMVRSVRVYNSCSEALTPPSIPLRPTGFGL